MYKLSQNNVRLETRARFELDAESACDDTQVHMVCPAGADSDVSLWVMLTSRQAQQFSVYTVTHNEGNHFGSLSPVSAALYQAEESSPGLFALKDCVVQVTSSGVHVWSNNVNNRQVNPRAQTWHQLLQEAIAKGTRLSTINHAGERKEVVFAWDKAATFRVQFVVSVSATCLVVICEDILVHVKVSAVGNTFTWRVLHIVQLHAAVCSCASEAPQEGKDAMLFVSFWPDIHKMSAAVGDPVYILRCVESTGIHYMHQVEHAAPGLTQEPLRYLSTITLFHSPTVHLYALFCAYPSGDATLYHVLHNVRDNTVEHALVRIFTLAGGVEAVVTVESSTQHTFLVSSAACEYAVTSNTLSSDVDVLNVENLCSVVTWRCNETSVHIGVHRVSFSGTACIPSAGGKVNPVAWIEMNNFTSDHNDHLARVQHTALCLAPFTQIKSCLTMQWTGYSFPVK